MQSKIIYCVHDFIFIIFLGLQDKRVLKLNLARFVLKARFLNNFLRLAMMTDQQSESLEEISVIIDRCTALTKERQYLQYYYFHTEHD